MDLAVFNEEGKEVGKISFDEKQLGEKVRKKLMHQAIVRHEANQRLGTHKAKSKAERHGSGVKPWKQKHTGRARAGMKRSPLWKGGGNVFPPRPRDYRKDMPIQMRREALKSALLSKFLDKEVRIIDTLDYKTPKTKRFAATLKNLGLNLKSCLIAVNKPAENLVKSARNLDNALLVPARNLNCYEVLKYKNLLLTKDTLQNLKEVVK